MSCFVGHPVYSFSEIYFFALACNILPIITAIGNATVKQL